MLVVFQQSADELLKTMQASDKKQKSRRTLDSIIRFTSSVGEQTSFTGSFKGGENLVVRGSVQGDSDVQGVVVVTDTGSWQGHLSAEVVIIAGEFTGNITAREKIEIYSSAKVTGNLTCPSIAIETGAVHQGHIDMGKGNEIKRFENKREPYTIEMDSRPVLDKK